MNTFGERLRLHVFGESHGPVVGGVLDGLPPGMPLDLQRIQRRMDQRRPGTGPHVSARKETDEVDILSGVFGGRATGAPLAFTLSNDDVRSQDYQKLRTTPRPGHADLTEHIWSGGHRDHRGGGHHSGRLTAVMVAAAAIAEPLLDALGVHVGAHVQKIGAIAGPTNTHDVAAMEHALDHSPVRTAHQELEASMAKAIDEARAAKDSVGGVVAWRAEGVPAALGDPMARGVESQLGALLLGIPAVKAVEFGAGFAAAQMTGAEHNDAIALRDGQPATSTNFSGGVLGGRTTGMPLWGSVAVKPTSSIAQAQSTVDLETGEETTIEVKGRHDPCIALRAAAVVRATVAFGLADLLLLGMQQGHVDVPTWSK